MNVVQKTKLLQKVVDLESQIDQLKKVRIDLVSNGYQSATISTSSGSKSYTRIDVDKITNMIKALQQELKAVRNLLKGDAATSINTIVTVYS